MSYLSLEDLHITFPTDKGPLNVLNGVDLKVEQGEFISLIGHSGCGKSTVLNIVAGLLEATKGGVLLEGREVTEPGPDRAVVFQNHSLLPWLSVYDNVRLAVDKVFKKSKTKAERDEWTRHNLELVHMSHALDRKPDEISGGMKQRVGIARALAMEPKVLLMDEPFGALDSLTRTHMQDSLMEIQTELNNTVIMITHDVDEAVLLSDRIVMMTNGPSATIGEVLHINLPRPRNRIALADDPLYNHYRAEVLRFLHERHSNPEKQREAEAEAAMPQAKVHDLTAHMKKPDSKPERRLEKTELKLGFIPLTDCAPLVVAKEMGLFHKHGLKVSLSRESSWANIRDKVGTGMLDGAQMLAALPLATTLSTSKSGNTCAPMVTAMNLDLNGNAITVSEELYARMEATGISGIDTAMGSAQALRIVVDEMKAAGEPPLNFGMVFPVSTHNYLLRYWMAAAGIDPDEDVKLTVVPPPQMVNYLRAGVIAGYCVGEPWNSYAVTEGLGRIVTTSHGVWNNHPEKVFGVTRAWANANPNTHTAAVSALLEACAWIEQPENRGQLCDLLSQGRYVNAPVDVLEASLTGSLQRSADADPVAKPDFNVFHRYAANFPWRSHAIWLMTQMIRWGQLDQPVNLETVAKSVYRPDTYRAAAESLGIAYPEVDYKQEGTHSDGWALMGGDESIIMGPDQFMDGREFDAREPAAYISGFEISHCSVSIEALASLNNDRAIAEAS
ncbi:MAG: nitrate ABC transporter ATP-binding protein [Gammaproteobacteria bacterium]